VNSVYYTATRLAALAAALVTLVLLIFMAQPWGDNYAYQSLSGYVWLLGFGGWAILPYLMLLFLAREAYQSQRHLLLVMIGAVIISLGGAALYIDSAFIHQDPQGALVFIAVPICQWIILGLLTGIHFFLSKNPSS
jgi:hypothetical protein